MRRTIYLAGPEVFHSDGAAIGREKKRVCDLHGFVGLYPGDLDLGAGERTPARIFAGCLHLLRAADIVVANLTPFRGVSADVGTVFEVGYAHALGKPVFGYSHRADDLRARVGQASGPLRSVSDGRLHAADGMSVEDFGLADNLMVAGCLPLSGADLVRPAHEVESWTDLSVFQACLQRAARILTPDTIP